MDKRYVCLFLAATLVGCGNNLAPVTELKWQSSSQAQSHVVRRGETLYAIAFRYDTDYRTLARINHVSAPYSLRVGQVLNVNGIKKQASPLRQAPVYQASRPTPVVKPQQTYSPSRVLFGRAKSAWQWPVEGRLVTSFNPDQGKKGINIACTSGCKVIASASGVVAYAGSGLTGYGNLIIIKHSNEFLTAYGNNARMMVSEGQQVHAGQVIAEAGLIDHKYKGVHFEIRKRGIPVNPLNYLQKG